jgi:hypothetical protein
MVKYTPPASALKVAFSNDPAPLDPVRAEVVAMETIAEAMATVSPEARGRVMRWAGELFGDGAATAATKPAGAAAAVGGDLSVGDLADFFEAKPEDLADQTDLLDLAECWPVAPANENESEIENEKEKQKEPIVSMIHGFVEDFKKLARDWESA